MTFTYSAALDTDLAKVRLAINDTEEVVAPDSVGCWPDGSNYTDEELGVYMDLADNWQHAVVLVLMDLVIKWSLEAAHAEGSISQNASAVADNLKEAIKFYETRMPPLSSVGVSYNSSNADGTSPIFPFGDRQFRISQQDQRRDV